MIRKIGLPLLFAAAFVSAPIALAADGMAGEWDGFHVGGDALYGMGASDLNTNVSNGGTYFGADSVEIAAANALGQEHAKAGNIAASVDAGYDWQFSHFVFGLDGELTNLALNESTGGFAYVEGGDEVFTEYQSLHTDWSAALRPHVGLAFGDFLIEANAGVSFLHATYQENFYDIWNAEAEEATASRFLMAPVLGVAARYHVSQNWVAKLDFSFAKYGQAKLDNSGLAFVEDQPEVTAGQGALWHTFDLTTETVSLGLDYQF